MKKTNKAIIYLSFLVSSFFTHTSYAESNDIKFKNTDLNSEESNQESSDYVTWIEPEGNGDAMCREWAFICGLGSMYHCKKIIHSCE